MQWKLIDENTPKDKILLGWDQKQMSGKGLPRVMIWGNNIRVLPNRYCWMSLELAVEFEPTLYCEIEFPINYQSK